MIRSVCFAAATLAVGLMGCSSPAEPADDASEGALGGPNAFAAYTTRYRACEALVPQESTDAAYAVAQGRFAACLKDLNDSIVVRVREKHPDQAALGNGVLNYRNIRRVYCEDVLTPTAKGDLSKANVARCLRDTESNVFDLLLHFSGFAPEAGAPVAMTGQHPKCYAGWTNLGGLPTAPAGANTPPTILKAWQTLGGCIQEDATRDLPSRYAEWVLEHGDVPKPVDEDDEKAALAMFKGTAKQGLVEVFQASSHLCKKITVLSVPLTTTRCETYASELVYDQLLASIVP